MNLKLNVHGLLWAGQGENEVVRTTQCNMRKLGQEGETKLPPTGWIPTVTQHVPFTI